MTETITKAVIDCSTGLTEIVPLNEEELAQLELDVKARNERMEIEKAQAEAKAAAKASAEAKLAALGLTAEEISAL
jgi:hypothetical protein